MKILIIDDDENIVEFLKKSLGGASYLVECASDGQQAICMSRSSKYDLLLLDYSLPIMNGAEVLREIRADKNNVPVLMLTVKSDILSKKEAYELGADDYLTKPFLLDELLLKIKALLQRPKIIENHITKIGDLSFNSNTNCFKRGGLEIYLTRREHCLLEYLLRRRNEIVSRGDILEHVWDYKASPFSNSIETHINSLRRKLNQRGRNLIHTFSGRGYKLSLRKLN